MYLFALLLALASPLMAHENMDCKGGVLELLPITNRWVIVVTEEKAAPFTIHSFDDANYYDQKSPLRAEGKLVALDRKEAGSMFDIEWVHYNYLELPTAFEHDHSYTITSATGQEVTLTYNEETSVSRAIKVNQLGWLPESPKFAYLGAWLGSFGPLPFDTLSFEVIRAASQEIAYRGKITLREKNPHLPVSVYALRRGLRAAPELFGEDIYEIDFSDLKESGDFYIFIPGVGRSFSFHIGPQVYGEAFYQTARTLFHNRCGMEIPRDCTAWSRPQCHEGKGYLCDHIPFTGNIRPPPRYDEDDVIGESLSPISVGQITGGWHESLDASKHLNMFTILFDLLGAYELNPTKFSDGQLHIPESKNGIPDILDEAEYGLSLYHNIFAGDVIAWDKGLYAVSRQSRWGSLLYAAAASQFSKLVAPFSKEKALEYLEIAKEAYEFGCEAKNGFDHIFIRARTREGEGKPYTLEWTENKRALAPYVLFARLHLFEATGDKKYLPGITEWSLLAWKEIERKDDLSPLETWLCFEIIKNEKIVQAAPWKRIFYPHLTRYLNFAKRNPYRISWDLRDIPSFPHEIFPALLSRCRTLLLGAQLLGQAEYRQVAIANLDFLFGANPQCMSWVTGVGSCYPTKVFAPTLESESFIEAMPGLVIFGPGRIDLDPAHSNVWQENPNVPMVVHDTTPLFRTWSAHPHNMRGNQFDLVHLESPLIFSTACLMGEKWMPSEKLLEQRPRAKVLLPGYFPMP